MTWWSTRRCAALAAARDAAQAVPPAHWVRPDCPVCQGTGGDEGLGCAACWEAFLEQA